MNVVIVGAQWGDEGKGKVVDLYSAQANWIVRYQGGNNAGHTLVVGGKKTVLHLIPSGVLHPGKTCLIGNGVVLDPSVFFQEVDALIASGVLTAESASRAIRVSDRAHVILPYHRLIDRLREEFSAKKHGKNIGTTGRGIGPAYEDKIARRGIQVGDLLRPNSLRKKIERAIEEKAALLEHHFQSSEKLNLDALTHEATLLGEKLRPFVSDTRVLLQQAFSRQEPVLFEGAQGALLDIDHGTYPFVTSSNTTAGGALTGTGAGPTCIDHVIGIAKAYATRVGSGPFPTELDGKGPQAQALADQIRSIGKEFGATTGRMRRVGWLDLVALKYATEVNGLTGLALMKSDVLNGLDELKVCTAYRLHGKTVEHLPTCAEELESIEPVYETLSGWGPFQLGDKPTLSALPAAFQNYVRKIEQFLGIPVVLISTGPGREETLVLRNPFGNPVGS